MSVTLIILAAKCNSKKL